MVLLFLKRTESFTQNPQFTQQSHCFTSPLATRENIILLGMVRHTCLSSMGEAKAGRSPQLPGHYNLQQEFQANWGHTVKPYLKPNKTKAPSFYLNLLH